MTPETLEAVRNGVLTDVQLAQALDHYRELVPLLRIHGERYHLVWLDAFHTLEMLERFKTARANRNKKNNTPFLL